MPPNLGADVNPISATLVSRLLLKDPDSRPASARDVEAQLTQVDAPLAVAEVRLLRAAKAHVDGRARRDSALAAERVESERKQAVERQAVSDLRSLYDVARARIEGLVQGLRLSERDANSDFRADMVWEFRSEDAMLAVVLWASVTDWQVPGDTIVLAGEVVASNRFAPHVQVRLANIVYEGTEGQLRWNLYRFKAAPGNSRYGPEYILHGFSLVDFGKTRRYQIDRTYDGWTLEKVVLTAESMVELLAEALEMRLPTR